MKSKLIALVALAAGAVASLHAGVDAGTEFEVDAADGDLLLAEGRAKAVETATAQPPAKKEKTVKVRVLCACAHGKPNDVVELPEGVAKQSEKAGLVDADKAAVAYAESLKRES